jgi:Tfp pilus assembly PilM family ATPase
MIKRCIGIDIGSTHLCAVQVSRTGQRFCIEKTFCTKIRRSTDSPRGILKTLTAKHGFDRHADIAVSMPHDAVFFRNLETGSADPQEISLRNSPAFEHDFPIRPDEIIAQAYSQHQLAGQANNVLVAAVARAAIRERLNTLADGRVHPALVDAPIFAIFATATINHPEITAGNAIIAHIDESCLTLAIAQNGNILAVRKLPVILQSDNGSQLTLEQLADLLSNEAQITWRKLFDGEIEQDTKVFLAAQEDIADRLATALGENLHCQITVIEPCANVHCSADYNGDGEICVAEGLALRILAPESTTGVNFFEADNAETEPKFDLKKQFMISAALLAAIVVVSLAGLFVRLLRLEGEHARVQKEIKEVFQSTLPEEKNIVNPLAQLTQKLESLRNSYGPFGYGSDAGTGPLDVLREITACVPQEQGITISNMLITAESVRLAGTSRSFQPVYDWQQRLNAIPRFSTVNVEDIHRGSEGGLVNFTILLSLATSERK